MSIIHAEPSFAILDEQKYYNSIYKSINNRINPEFFEINGKFMPDSQFEAIKRCGGAENRRKISKRKRKREEQDSESENQVLAGILKEKGTKLGYFRKIEEKDNNLKAREAAKRVEERYTRILEDGAESCVEVREIGSTDTFQSIFQNPHKSNWIRNPGGAKWLKSKENREFLIPENSTFHIGCVTDVNKYSENLDIKFDLIVADPPWINGSVKRKRNYEMNEDVLDLVDFPKISAKNGLLVFWITNRAGILEEMEERLNRWKMEQIGIWKWLKVTKEGEPVFDFEKSGHKLPYEKLMLVAKQDRDEGVFDELPEDFLFGSVPMSVHSHKPPIYHLLEHHFKLKFENRLELFARSLLPNTTSVGFQPLYLQTSEVFI